MVNQSASTRLSNKALGKRPMRNGGAAAVAAPSPLSVSAMTPSADSLVADDETDDGSLATSMAGSAQTRYNNNSSSSNHKRVLPSRARRGGVGSLVGTNEIDMNILDQLKRRGESEPLIPEHTVFVLTTDSSMVPSTSTLGIGFNQVANERYFDRPEVIRAYKAQQDIQVPEFIQLEDEVCGGRLRARSGEVENVELSDAAYERRHRRHEMAEKRQRMWEKEKMQHAHYKLKERIDQLRNMDYNAFLALPGDIFGDAEPAEIHDWPDGGDVGAGSAAAMHEAERRRKIMLDVALTLEERYRTLLPPDRKYTDLKSGTRPPSPTIEINGLDEEPLVEPEQDRSTSVASNRSKASTRHKLRLRTTTAQPVSPSPTTAVAPTRRRRAKSVVAESPPALAPTEVESKEHSGTAAPNSILPSRTAEIGHDNSFLKLHDSHPKEWDNYFRVHAEIMPQMHNETTNMPYIPSVENKTSFISFNNIDRHHPAVTGARQASTVSHYINSSDVEPSLKKVKTIHIPVTIAVPSPGHNLEKINEPPDHTANTESPDSAATLPAQVEHFKQAPHIPPPPELLPSELAPTEFDELESSRYVGSLSPYDDSVSATKDSSFALRMPHMDHLRSLEQPDGVEGYDVFDQTSVSELPPIDDGSVTPSQESESTSFAEYHPRHTDFALPISTEPVNPRLRRQSTPYARQSRESSASPFSGDPKELFKRPIPLPLPELKCLESYELTHVDGRWKRPKPSNGILAASKYNEEPGRKTSRNVRAFGIEAPSFEDDAEFGPPFAWVSERCQIMEAGCHIDGDGRGASPSLLPSISGLGRTQLTPMDQ